MEKHRANVELAKRLKEEIVRFFDEDNNKIYKKYFTEEEAVKLRSLNYAKKNVAIIDKLSETLKMSHKTFYHMLNGKNSQFDKIVRVLEFFGLTFDYNVYYLDERVKEVKKDIYFKDIDKSVTELEDQLIQKILLADEDTQRLVNEILFKFEGEIYESN